MESDVYTTLTLALESKEDFTQPLLSDTLKPHRISQYTLIHDLLYCLTPQGPRRVLTKDDVPLVLYECHAGLTSVHFKIGATTKCIKDHFWWPKMHQDIEQFIK